MVTKLYGAQTQQLLHKKNELGQNCVFGHKLLEQTLLNTCDENQQAFKDPLHVPVGLITKARSKKIKEALNGLIQEIWANSNVGHSKLGPKKDEGVINLIQAIEG